MNTLNPRTEWSRPERCDAVLEDIQEVDRAIGELRRSAIVWCADEELMSLASHKMIRLLRRRADVRLELLQPTSADALMGRFNALVESMPLHVAQRDVSADQGLTVWVMHLRRRLELPDLRILIRMIQGFPGTGVRLLLWCSGDAASDRVVQAVSTWGPRLHQCLLSDEPRTSERAAGQADRFEAPPLRVSAAPVAPPQAAVLHTSRTGSGAAEANRMEAAETAPVRWRLRTPKWWAAGGAWAASLARPQVWWALGGMVLSIGTAAMAWWQLRGASEAGLPSPARRPVPEIVELLEDVRPPAVHQGVRP